MHTTKAYTKQGTVLNLEKSMTYVTVKEEVYPSKIKGLR